MTRCPPTQRAFTAAVQLYDKGDFQGSVALFEEALVEYYKADVECRAVCQWPQKFEGYDYLRYRYSLYEVISGKTVTRAFQPGSPGVFPPRSQ